MQSLAQKKARENFKKAIEYRKKTGCSLKQAFAHVKGKKTVTKKVGTIKNKAVKKAAKKKVLRSPLKKTVSKKTATKNNLKYAGAMRSQNGKKMYKYSLGKAPVGTHKDTKSHNVNIRVISGITKTGELKRLTELASNSNHKIEKKVAAMLKSKVINGGYDSLRSVMNDVLNHGLQSGIISELIYYSDTLKFFKTYKKDIMDLLREQMFETGISNPSELFGRNWDIDDPFAHETQNQNLLAWFGFEEITRYLANQLGYDI